MSASLFHRTSLKGDHRMESIEVTVNEMAGKVAEYMKLNNLLSDYVGRIVPIWSKEGTWVSAKGKTFPYKMHAFTADRSLINEMIAIIEQHGLSPRITFPETIITADFRPDRYNIHLLPISDDEARVDIVGIG